MNPSPAHARRLGIEALETRTLLAGAADPFGLVADYNATMLAVSGTGDFSGSFSTNFGNRQLVLTGTADTSITIDMDKLPDFITHLKITGFASVNLVGTDTVQTMILSDVDSVKAPNLTVTGALQSNNVDVLQVGNAGKDAVLTFTGTTTDLRVDQFAEGAMILSNLQALTLSTDDDYVLFVNIPNEQYAEQYLYLKDYNPGLGVTPVDPSGIAWSNIRNWEPPVVDPGVPTDPGTPTDPTTPDDPGIPQPPTSSDGGFVIIDLPLDELTRSFVLQLRALLASSSTDLDKLVADFLASRDHSDLPLGAAIADESSRGALHLPGFSGPVDGDIAGGIPMPGFAVMPRHLDVMGALSPLPDSLILANLSEPAAVFDVMSAVAPVHAMTPTSGSLHLITVSPTDADSVHLAARVERTGRDEPTLAETFEALGSYIAQRVSAEFTPGQQSFVLMVDPPPPRGLAGSRKIIADRAAAPASVSLPNPAIGLV